MIFLKGTTKSLGQKNKFDKFYTNIDIVKHCLSQLDLTNYDLIIEPSAGNGSFSNEIDNCVALDIEPEAPNIIQQDFFTYKPPEGYNKILIIGNPPFGQQSTLAVKFFNYSATFADTIAFILPRSFKKYSLQNQLNLYFKLIYEEDLPQNSFILEGKSYDVPCVFQIWTKQPTQREKIKLKTTSQLIEFTKNINEADFRIQRVGGNAGKAFIDKKGALSSNYYIINKTSLNTLQLIEILNNISYPSITFTVGPKSLSKGELILEIENILLDNNKNL